MYIIESFKRLIATVNLKFCKKNEKIYLSKRYFGTVPNLHQNCAISLLLDLKSFITYTKNNNEKEPQIAHTC